MIQKIKYTYAQLDNMTVNILAKVEKLNAKLDITEDSEELDKIIEALNKVSAQLDFINLELDILDKENK